MMIIEDCNRMSQNKRMDIFAASETTPRWMEMEMENAVPCMYVVPLLGDIGFVRPRVGHPILRLPPY